MSLNVVKYSWNENKEDIMLKIDRPNKAREIPLTTSSNRGFMPSLKARNLDGNGNKRIWEYESLLEHDFLLMLDHDPNCLDLQTQPIEFVYSTKSKNSTKFYPDIWAVFKDGKEFLFEVKTEKQWQEMQNDCNWKLKFEEIKKECSKRNWNYMVVTEKKIRNQRLENLKHLITSAKHSIIDQTNDDLLIIDKIRKYIEDNNYTKTFTEICNAISQISPLPIEIIISLLKNQLYFGYFSFDWDTYFENAVISNKLLEIIPIYKLPDFEKSIGKSKESDNLLNIPTSTNLLSDLDKNRISQIIEKFGDKATREDIRDYCKENDYRFEMISKLYSQWKREEKYVKRKTLIQPIVKKFGRNGKKTGVLQFCINDLMYDITKSRSAYNYYIKWRKGGDGFLYPKQKSKHSKSYFGEKIEFLLNKAIIDWNNLSTKKGDVRKTQKQVTGSYDDFIELCENNGISYEDIPSLTTFWRRINELPAIESHGKFSTNKSRSIKRGLKGVYKEGKHPGSIIQIDHTLADIWLVDEFTREAYSRPWITIGVDVKTRSIWGIFLSPNPPSQESVAQCILSGLINKNKLKAWNLFEGFLIKKGKNPDNFKWNASGFPGKIQVDNSLDFRARSIKKMCMDQNITLEFRPIKTPEYGGFIESIWDTINDAIRNENLPGKVFSLPKMRKASKKPKFTAPKNYNPKKEAQLTFYEFSQWIYAFIILKFNSGKRSRQKNSPNQIWKDGKEGLNKQSLGGALKILDMDEFHYLNYTSKEENTSVLSERGFRNHNVYYSSKWLREARKQMILRDGEKYTYKVSKWDRRFIWMKDPQDNILHVLQCYNYEGDDRILQLLLDGIKYNFEVPQDIIDHARSNIVDDDTKRNQYDRIIMFKEITKKIKNNTKLTIKDKKLLENILKSDDGLLEGKVALLEGMGKNQQMKSKFVEVEDILDDPSKEIEAYDAEIDDTAKWIADMFGDVEEDE
ncbi:MAG: DDE-type integrase/transposase/recombinase [Candidatus Heimdallarchaeota archaeon]|nr:DDE-type integrase/transposase/recombinase [Candidatus Heimdallarchaeota archaeon]